MFGARDTSSRPDAAGRFGRALRHFCVGLATAAALAWPACTFPDVTIADGPPLQPCNNDAQCPVGATSCLVRSCRDHACTLVPAGSGTGCGNGEQCDGAGACVECLGPNDCAPTVSCEAGACVALHCHNQALDAGETSIDCGAECPPCGDGGGCSSAGDCESGYCAGAPTGICSACSAHAQCPGGYCEADGRCVARKDLGVSCTSDAQCATSHCPAQDQVCCEIACDGPCTSCSGTKSGGASGQCLFIPSDADPDEECLLACNGSGKCQIL